MGFFDFLKPKTKPARLVGKWQELGGYNAIFSPFGREMYRSPAVRSCIRPLAEHTSKARAVCVKNPQLERILNEKPNLYMNGKDFLSKIRTRLELTNTVFILISRDATGHAEGFYPIPYMSFQAVEYANGLFIEFTFENNQKLTASWLDLAVLRKDYNKSDIAGDDNGAILETLERINISNQGVTNAVKATANLRGILKSTKAMLSAADIKRQKDEFVRDYLSLENSGGIASLDATQEFTPISMNPTVTSWETLKEFRQEVNRYFGVSDAIILSDYTEEQMEAFTMRESSRFWWLLVLSLRVRCSQNASLAIRTRLSTNQAVFSTHRTRRSWEWFSLSIER